MRRERGTTVSKSFYLAVDVGGTNIQAALVKSSGRVLGREKTLSPRSGGPEPILQQIEQVIETLLEEHDLLADRERLKAIGIAIPGVVDPTKGHIVVTPNMELSDVAIGPRLESRFGVPVALGNDCNLGTLGEKWLGAARNAESVVGMLVGTGIGGGIVFGSKLWRGARESACEIGHTVIEIDGPECGCGNRGCLEALASRTAIEREIRRQVDAGRETVLTELLGGNLEIIRSSVLRKAMIDGDPLVTEVMNRASEVLGNACLTIRHLIDPEVIVLGGGVIDACSRFMMPVIERIVEADQLPGASEGGRVLVATLGDDAVLLGAVAQAKLHLGKNPFKKKHKTHGASDLPTVTPIGEDLFRVKQKQFDQTFYITVNGKAKTFKSPDQTTPKQTSPETAPLLVHVDHLVKACKGGPELLLIGSESDRPIELDDSAKAFLQRRAIQWETATTTEAIRDFNEGTRRRALLIFKG